MGWWSGSIERLRGPLWWMVGSAVVTGGVRALQRRARVRRDAEASRGPRDADRGAASPPQGPSAPAVVAQALTSGALEDLLAAWKSPASAAERHELLLALATYAYDRREEPEMHRLLVRVAETHLAEYPGLFPDRSPPDRSNGSNGDTPPVVDSFRQLAIALAESGELRRAIEVCETAIRLRVEDGTKTGFRGRIRRLRRRAEA